MELAIIIPTKNEEKTLPCLINSIKEQTFKDFKIIVADHPNSTDRTKEIAKEYECDVITGGNPSQGRNRGIERAIQRGFKLCMIIDADSILPSEDFIEKALKEFKDKCFDLAGTLQNPFDTKIKLNLKSVIKSCRPSKNFGYKLIYGFANFFLKAFQNTKNPCMGNGIFLKTGVYELIGGFDETIEFGEDSRYARYVVKKGYKFGILKEPDKIFTSPRRFEEKGFLNMAKLYIYLDIKLLFGYKFKVNGKFRYFKKHENNKRNNKLQ